METHIRLMLPFEEGDITPPDAGPIAVFRAHGTYPFLDTNKLICLQGFYPSAAALQNSGLTTASEPPSTATLSIVHVTRSKEENRALVAQACECLEIGAQLIVDGAKTNGIESLLKAVKKRMPIDGQLSKAHGKVFWLTKQSDTNPFTDWAAAAAFVKNSDGWVTTAGVFSADGIDPGSAELAPFIAGKLKGKVADLGAGWGWLAVQALQSNPAIEAIDLYEAEQSSLECARQNVTDPRAKFHWSDVTRIDTKNTHDAVIMNPPFHTGRKADPALGRAFIASAARLLKPNGQMFLVANRQLAYEAALDASFARHEEIHHTGRYKIIYARKPK